MATSKLSDTTNADKISIQSKSAVEDGRINMQIVQNVLLVWLDHNIDDNDANCHNTIMQLRCVVNNINIFTDRDRCVDFLTDIHNENVCMIISDALCQQVVPAIHDLVQLHTIFILCENQTKHEQWAKNWSKIKGIFTDISSMYEVLKQEAQKCEQNSISFSLVTTDDDLSKKNLDQLDPMFMYSQILKEILLVIKFENKHFMEFIGYCRELQGDNQAQLRRVKNFEENYRHQTPVWWYSSESFLYPMLNHALRLLDVDVIIKMGFYIGDLYHQIEDLHKEQFTGTNLQKELTLYRGQGMSKEEFERVTKTKGGLLSFNSFLSTTTDYDVSYLFAVSNADNPNLVGVLFVMTIDPLQSTAPFTSITNIGQFEDEQEILFAMHTVFRIQDITPMNNKSRLFMVELTLTSDDDKDLRMLTNRIREETCPDADDWERLSVVLLKMGQYNKAEQVYQTLLQQETEESQKATIYHQIGMMKFTKGEHKEAIRFHEKTLEIYKRTRSPNDPDFAKSYVAHGLVYNSIGEHSQAIEFYENAVGILKQAFSPNHSDLAGIYNNIGTVYKEMGEYAKAVSSHHKALGIQKESLLPNHPDLAVSYGNIGNMYCMTGEYSRAISSYEKALGIQQKSLPPNHPHLAASYDNIANVYNNMGKSTKAIEFHEKALEIQEKSLPTNQFDLGCTYNNIGTVHSSIGEYFKALSYYEKALAIHQQCLPPNHPHLFKSYNNIGEVYRNIGEYSKAISSHQKALVIQEQSFPSSHPDLAMSYGNIGNVYLETGESSKALSHYKKALKIQQQSLPPNHPYLGISYKNIAILYKNMGEYSKAIDFYEKAVKTQEQSLPSDHPHLTSSYNDIAILYRSMGECSKALSYYEKAFEIKQKTNAIDQLSLASTCGNMGLLYEQVGNFSKARLFFEKAMNAAQNSLPSSHPDLQQHKNNLYRIKNKL